MIEFVSTTGTGAARPEGLSNAGDAAAAGGTGVDGAQTLVFSLLLAQDVAPPPGGAVRMAPTAGGPLGEPAGWPGAAQQPLAAALLGAPVDGNRLPVDGKTWPDGAGVEQSRMVAALSESLGAGAGRHGDAPLLRPGSAESLIVLPASASPPVGAPGAAAPPSGVAAQSAAWHALAPGSAEFDTALGQRLLWLAGQGVHDARLQVHPEHLGPIDLRLRLDGDGLQLLATASHSVTRDALEQAIPRLREQLADAGVQLTQADVGERSPDGRRGAAAEGAPEAAAGEEHGAAPAGPVTIVRRLDVPPLLDLFA